MIYNTLCVELLKDDANFRHQINLLHHQIILISKIDTLKLIKLSLILVYASFLVELIFSYLLLAAI